MDDEKNPDVTDDQLEGDSNESPDGGTDSSPDKGGKPKDKGKEKDEFKPITSQSQFDAMLFDRMERLKKSVRATVESELKEEASAQAAKEAGNYKDLYDKAQAKLEKLEGELKEVQLSEIKARVAREAKLPASMIDRLRGETEEELMDDAKKLVADIAPLAAPDIDGGATNNGGRRQTKKKDDVDYSDPKVWGLPQ